VHVARAFAQVQTALRVLLASADNDGIRELVRESEQFRSGLKDVDRGRRDAGFSPKLGLTRFCAVRQSLWRIDDGDPALERSFFDSLRILEALRIHLAQGVCEPENHSRHAVERRQLPSSLVQGQPRVRSRMMALQVFDSELHVGSLSAPAWSVAHEQNLAAIDPH
jgi:hypothetical protein